MQTIHLPTNRVGKTLAAALARERFRLGWRESSDNMAMEVLAQRARHVPLTPETVALRLELERVIRVGSWVARARMEYQMRAPHKWLIGHDGTIKQLY